MKFTYAHNVESDEPIMLINKHIGYDENDGQGVDGAKFLEELMILDSLEKKRIQVWINSVGGVVLDGYNICAGIQKTKTPVDTYCVGMAASIAGVIFQCGRKRVMADYGILMYHNPYSGKNTESPLLDTMKESLNTIISQRSGMGVDAVHRMMDRTSFIGANEAYDLGLCDSLEQTVKLNTKYQPKVYNDSWRFMREANRALNKIFKTETTKMKNVTNKLQLVEDASEESILAGIEAIEKRATAAEGALTVSNKKSADDLAEMGNKVKTAEDALAAMKKEYEAAKAEADSLKDAANKAAAALAAEKAATLVENAVKEGKIKNEAKNIAEWKAKAVADLASVSALLEGIAVNKQAVRFKLATTEAENASKYPSVAAEMVAIENRLAGK